MQTLLLARNMRKSQSDMSQLFLDILTIKQHDVNHLRQSRYIKNEFLIPHWVPCILDRSGGGTEMATGNRHVAVKQFGVADVDDTSVAVLFAKSRGGYNG